MLAAECFATQSTATPLSDPSEADRAVAEAFVTAGTRRTNFSDEIAGTVL